MKDLNIPSIGEIQEETATSTDYYGEQRINAKGYTLVDCLSIDKIQMKQPIQLSITKDRVMRNQFHVHFHYKVITFIY